MFNIALKSFLYLILAICISWGIIVVSAPQIIQFLANKTFGDELRIYNLRVTPKLALVASRVEFSNALLFPKKSTFASVRGVELDWAFEGKLVPEIILTTGPIRLDDSVALRKTSVTVDLSNAWGLGSIDFNFNASEVTFPEMGLIGNIELFGVYDYQSLELKNAEFYAKEFEIQKNLELKVASINGFIEDAKFGTNYMPTSVNKAVLNFGGFNINKTNLNIGSVNANYAVNDGMGFLELETDTLSYNERNFFAEDINFRAATTPLNFFDWKKITLNSEKILLPFSPYYEKGSGINNFLIVIENDHNNGFHVSNNGTFDLFELSGPEGFLVNLSKADFRFEANLESNMDLTKPIASKIFLKSNSSPAIVVEGVTKFSLSDGNFVNCFASVDCISKLESEFEFVFEDSKLTGSSYCVLPGCYKNGSEHIFQSDDTAEFFGSAMKSKIFNPFLLTFIYSTLSKGQKVGSGHILKF